VMAVVGLRPYYRNAQKYYRGGSGIGRIAHADGPGGMLDIRPSQAILTLTLVSHLMTTRGFPLPGPTFRKPTDGVPYPCQFRSCGCLTSEQCWQGDCCCFTLAQKRAWGGGPGLDKAVAAATKSALGRGWPEVTVTPRRRVHVFRPAPPSPQIEPFGEGRRGVPYTSKDEWNPEQPACVRDSQRDRRIDVVHR